MKSKQINKTLIGKTGKDLLGLMKAKDKRAHKLDIVAPSGEDEVVLFGFWESLLGHNNFGVQDDFFQIGGNSLKAIQLLSRISSWYAVNIQLTDIFLEPTIVQLAALIGSKKNGHQPAPLIQALKRPSLIPLSYNQERLWFIDQLEGSVAYHIPAVLRLKGKLNKAAINFAFNEIVNRHEVLRTVIHQQDGQGYQLVLNKDTWKMQEIDGSTFATDNDKLQHLIQGFINQPFDLLQHHMIRVNLVDLSKAESLLVITLHHIASDGWSTSIIIEELIKFYDAFEKKQPLVLKPLEIQYADFALWQRSPAQAEVLENKLGYWKVKLQGIEPLQLPTDFERPLVQSTNGATKTFTINRELIDKLEALSQQNGVTLFMSLLATLNVLLNRYTGQEDICVGTAIAGRQQQEVEGLIGFFVNTLALRSTIHHQQSFNELLQQVKATTLQAYQHQEVPFEKVVEAVVKERDMSRSPLFQVMMVLQNTPDKPAIQLGEVILSEESFERDKTKFELDFSLTEIPEGLVGSVEYCKDLYTEQTIENMLAHFKELLHSVTATPEQNIGQLEMLSSSEKNQLLFEFNNTFVEYPKDKNIVSLFEEQVMKTPDAIAVIFENYELTYQQLNERSNQLAHYLHGKGVKAETLVPVCIERSLDMLVGIMGILKSGAAYVPIDPGYPAERINYMLGDTASSLLISSRESRLILPVEENIEVIEIDGKNSFAISKQPVINPQIDIKPAHLAYVIYTSGSTGKPKGVMIEHTNVYSFISWCRQEFSSDHFEVVYASTSMCFDLSVFEFFFPLSVGKRIRLLENGLEIGKYLAGDSAVMTNSVPVVIENLFKEDTDLSNISVINMAGEPIPSQVQLGLDADRIAVRNLYGPTEDTTYSTIFRLRNGEPITIGKPIANTSIRIVNRSGSLVPVGVTGEICIAGAGLARGYLKQLGLTAGRFVKDTFSSVERARMYKTGDLGRWLANGDIEYLGRIDDQVKIRGYRIELGEIETVLQNSGMVKQQVVLAKEDSNGNKRLIAYVVPAEEKFDWEAAAIFLKKSLPDYMVPAVWVQLENLPFTPNGKINRKALPNPGLAELATSEYVAPRNELEVKLAITWQELLNVKPIGINDNFFALGGHSLLAMRLLSTIDKQTGIKITLKELFAFPSIALLANYILGKTNLDIHAHIELQHRPQYIPLSFSQERLWFIDQLEGSVQYHLTSVYRLKGKLNIDALVSALQNIINRHEVLRTVVLEEDGHGYQFIKNMNEWNLDIIKCKGVKTDTQKLQNTIQQLIDIPFDLSKDYMLRGHLIAIKDNEYVLVVVMHHIASDAWSLPIIMKEVAELYSAAVQARPAQLTPLSIQYADYAMWQRNLLDGPVMDKSLQYWKQKLDGVAPLQLPTDYPRPAVQSTHGAITEFELDQPLSEQLLALSRQQNATLFMTLLTAFNVLLNRYSGQQDITVGSPVANRTQHEVTGLVGFFVNTLALRADLSDNPSFTTLLQQVKQTTLEAYEHQELPFEKVVDAVVKEKDMSRSPLFQVMFVLQNEAQEQKIRMGEVELSAEPFEGNTAKFELILNISQTAHGLKGSFEYCTDLYNESTINRLIGHFRELLGAIVQMPEQQTGKLRMLPQTETDQILVQFNDTYAEYPKDKTIVHLIEEQVEKYPSNVAVVFGKEQLTYRQLNERANQLAHYLRSNGVTSDTLVPICLERNMDMIIGIIGILKAGGAYVPIDPEYPPERISYMLEDTAATIVISSKDIRSKLQVTEGVKIIELDSHWATVNHQLPTTNNQRVSQPHHLAYVIYTSGSTGKPKGVLIEHRNIVRLFKNDSALYDFNEKDVWSVFHSFCFDFSVWEMYGALFYGGRMVIVPRHVTKDVTQFAELLLAEKVTVLNQTPSAFYVLQEALVEKAKEVSVRYVIFGGEALNPAKLQPWMQSYPNSKLINMYGITETTVHVTYQEIEWQHTLGGKSIIGKPIPTLSAYIVDSNQNLVPIGVAGELLIGGAGLARGYLNRPELTAERFIKDPFNKEPVARLYRTGDSGVWLPDGNIEYLGRIDEQVKIRGYRIELGEIETVLHECGMIGQAVVLAKADKEGNKRLVGYVIPKGPFNREAIIAYLQGKLPDYMVPALWVELEKLPLTANGKTDKKALPEPDASGQLQKQFIEPATLDEIKIAAIWKEILSVERVGIHDNFFELGGDSIKVIRVVNKLKKGFNKEVKVFDIYHAGTLHQLIPVINNSPSLDGNDTRITIREELEQLKNNMLPQLATIDEIEDIYPMSDIQSGMVYASLVNPELAIYHDQFAYPVIKNLDIPLFEKALKLLIQKHNIFRTAFNLDIHSEGLQIVYKTVPFKIEYINLLDTDTDATDFTNKFFIKERKSPFKVNEAPLWRFTVIHFNDHSVFVFQVHHALVDGWSVASFNTELNNLYLSLVTNPAQEFLTPLKVTYKDFIVESLVDRKNQDNKSFWLNELADYKRLDIFSREATSQKLNRTYSVDYLDILDKRTKKDGISLKGLFFGAYIYSLSMLTPEDELTVGVVSNTRPIMEDGDQLLGCFLNTIPARLKTSPKASSWKAWFEAAENKLVQLKQTDRTTLLQITNITGEKTLHENPFFDALFSFINFHVYENFENGLLNQQQKTGEETSFEEDSEDLLTNTYLNFIVIITGKVLKVHYRLRQKLKSGKSLGELNKYFDEVINCYLNHYDESINRDAIIAEEEKQLLTELKDGSVAYPKDKNVVGLFEEQVTKTPEATALVFEGQQLSFRELNERANQLAHYLRSRGVKEESLVPIFMERGLEMMVGIMGILKAGAAYVPIDAEFPADRISYMLEDTGSNILLCNVESRASLEINEEVDIIEIDGDNIEMQLQPVHNTNYGLVPSNAAYVIYTSGSTGKPKGVIIEHRNLVDYVFGLNNKVHINDCKSFALVSTIATDLGNTVIYASLLSGGALHLFSKDATTNVEMLHEYFAEHKIECLKIVPSHWKALCREEQLLLPSKLIVFGGEALRSEMVDNILATGTSCRVVNHYGPTETTIGTLLHLVEPGKKYGTTIPIGKPFSNTSVYVLSKDMDLSPVGVPGQLFIAGDGVARGYFNKPEITKEKFIQDPFANEPGSLMYGTGDLVKYLPDGNIEFIGRVDDQVKIRGYRIELGEIETAINQCEAVSQGAVLAREDKQGNKRLVAYIVPDGAFEKDDIITYLKGRLPEYMVPALLVELEALPLTANGKIDRKALPDPDVAEMQTNEYAAPRNDAEKALAAIWQELLDIESVGIHDNFFELGGDSIITIQLVSRARRAGYELQMGDVFTYQTIARLSSLLDQRSDTSATATGEQFLLEGASGLLPIQQWYFDKEPEEISHFNQTILLKIDKGIPESLIKRAIEQLTAHHDVLRFKYYKKEDCWYQVYEHQNEMSQVFTEDLQSIASDILPDLITAHSDRHQRSLDIEKGELVRVVLMQTPSSQTSNRLLLVVHHLAIDGVSWRILLEDLELLLSGFKNAGATDLGTKTSSYRQWYNALEKYGHSKRTQSQKKYWNKVVKNYQSLPVDKEYSKPLKVKDNRHQSMRLGVAQTRQLIQDVPRVYHTEINDILMAALAKTLTEFSNTDKVIIGMEGHGREHIEDGIDTSRTIGWFTTHYPVLLEVNRGKGEDDLVKNIKEQLRQVPDKGLGFGVLKYINKEEAYQGKPCWDLVFNYLGQADNVLSAGQGLSIATESAGPDRSAEYVVNEKLSVNGMVQGGELVLNWTYNDKQYEQETIIALVKKFQDNLELLIAHCVDQQKKRGSVFTPSDYGLGTEISYTELDNFSNESFNGKSRTESIQSLYRLSGLQQGMLFHGLYDESGAGYINHFWCDLINPDLDILRKSWSQVIKSHTVLRSAFYYDSFSIPVQSVYKQVKLPIEVIDYRGMSETDQLTAIKQLEESDRAMGFDFKISPLMRIYLLQLNENRYRMLWSNHHILFDGWSRSIMMGEFLKIYEELVAGKPLPAIDEDRYEDFIRYIEHIDKDKEHAYWQSYLTGVDQSTLLPFIGATAERTKGLGTYASLPFQVNKEITAKIESFAQRNRITTNTIMQGVWALLLHRYTGNNSIVYGVIVSGRPEDLQGVEHRVGMYINTLPLHASLYEDHQIISWLQGLQKDQVASRHFQSTPLQDIQALTGVKGDLFDSLFVFENYPISKVISGKQWSLEVENVHVIEQTNYPLNIVVASAEEIDIDFIYNKDLIKEEYITELRNHFEYVLLQITGDEKDKLGDIELLAQAAQHQLLVEFNNTKVDYPIGKTLVDMFEEQVEKTPGSIAVVFENRQFTYRELNERSNQLGHYLRSKGIKEETLVPICLDRSLEMIVGILGIVKAGAAYVPIDPEYPEDRVRYMLEDTGAAIALSNKNCISKMALSNGLKVIAIDTAWPVISQQPLTNVNTALAQSNLAYIIYTSGSTGKPKGVMNEHAGVINRLRWAQDYYNLTAEDSVLQKTTFCFDVSVWELFWPLLVGSRLVFAKPEGHKDPGYLKNIIDRQNITMLHFVPSMLGVFLSDLQAGECKGLKKVLCSGEVLKPSQVAQFIEKLPGAELHNLYGPTEAAIDVTYWSLSDKKEDLLIVPIGKPVANTSIYILDGRNGLVPLGGIGELNISGVQVARGYLNRPELTAEKFVNDPFKAGMKMYRTGDLGRWLPDGNIEYLGRIDEQVKIRGFRIELGEIEACLSLAEGIKNAKVVVTETDPLIGKKLNAYLEIDEEKLPLLNNYLHLLNNKQVQKTDLNILPNGLPVLSSNGNEVKFLYKEIFKDASYLKHGITLPENSCVLDIGANVGFFTVFLNVLSKNIKVYSFEPIPEVYDYLVANRELYDIRGKAFRLALLDKEQELEFVYYPQMTILSGIGEDRSKVKDVVRSYVENSEIEVLGTSEMDALLEMKLESRKVTCKAKTISQIIAEEKIEKIDLMKVDVENSEHLVIGGLIESDWDKIESIIIEVHDVDGRLDRIKLLLEEKGFQAHVEKENLLSKDDVLFNIYALRNRQGKGLSGLGDNETLRSSGWEHPQKMVMDITKDLEKKLPDYMVPSGIILMDQFPLTPNGKIDKKALPDPGSNELGKVEYEAPRTEMEKMLVGIWETLLQKQKVGIHDNFFELGGHSLLAMRVISAVRRELQKEMAIKMMFLYPTIKDLAAELENKEESLSHPAIKVHERSGRIPLSFSQERLWFIDKLEGTLQYHLPFIIRLKGNLNKDALANALQGIVNRHEVLRTVIRDNDGAGYQHVKEKNSWQIDIVEDLIFKYGTVELQQYIQQLIKAPFNLSSDNMFRAYLLNVGEADNLLVATMHHIASDGWSISIIVKELMELYGAYEENRPIKLLPLNIQYADYAIWQRNYLQGRVFDEKLGYWKNKLEGVATLQLPTDYPRPAVQSSRGARTVFTIDRELKNQLQLLSQQQGTTIFMTLLAAYKVLLHRYSGQQDICVGTPIASRNQQELESLIGFFINTLAIRSDLNDNPSFNSLLQQVKASTLEAYEHQDMPFEKVVEAVVKERDMSRNPLFQVLFTMQNTPEIPELKLGKINLSLEELEHTTSQLDIICNITETPNSFFGSVEYCTDLYNEETIQRMMRHFRGLLRSIVKAPQQRISALKMLGELEEHQLLIAFNDTSVCYHTGYSIVDLFEAQVTKNPAKPAVVFEEQQLSFQELNERANQLAAYLKRRGVKEEKLVPICMERSIDMLVGIWAILKAGGAYVPIDPEYPLERISYMLEDTRATIVLSTAQSLSKLPNEAHLDIVLIDDDWPMISMQSTENISTQLLPSQLAYVIYTSGSTGKPKGVMIEHANMLSYLLNNKTNYITDAATNAGSFIHLSYTFDASLTAMFMPILAGKCVVIGSKGSVDTFEDPNLQKYAPYDFIKITPSHLALLQPKMEVYAAILLTKKLVIGGEALFPGQFSYLAEEGLDVEIINEYGPTEATVGCSVFSFHTIGDDERLKNGISIGKPIDNVQLYILGGYNELVPLGIQGELCIGGAGLARGYLNRPDLTEEKFVKDPFSKTAGARMYKTGDLARWLPDGNIQYLGRKDEQVKIRGYRIELGEIEGVLRECALVSQAVVLAKENKEGIKHLVAYIVPVDEFDKEGIQEYMKNILPEYMMPVQWVPLETLPLTSNGKVDRKALPDPEASELLANQYIAPRNDFEKALVTIWQELLDVEEIGIHDNFFELGGDSIIIIQIVSRARRGGYEFLVSDVFTHQTIAGLSAMMEQKADNMQVVSGEQGMLTGESGLLPIQQWYLDGKDEGISHFNQAVLLGIDKSVTENELRNALDQLTTHHDALRFIYRQNGGAWKQEYGTNKGFLVVEDLQNAITNTLAALITEKAEIHQRSLDIEKGEIVRMALMQTPGSEKNNRLLFVIHHLAVDGISWRILLEDLELLLTGLKTGIPADMGRRGSSYRQWYEAMENYGSSTRLKTQQRYWEQVVNSYQPLPVDKQFKGKVTVKEMLQETIRLDANKTKALIQEVPRVYHTEINDILMGALAKTLCEWSDTTSVVIGLEGHGREEIAEGVNTSRTVGWFTSMYPVFLKINNGSGASAIIKDVKEQLRQVPDKGLGYGVLKYINKEEKFAGEKNWDIVFNYFGQVDNVVNTGKWLSAATEERGASASEDHLVNELIAINGMVQGGELVLNWSYSSKHYNPETITGLAAKYLANIELLIAHCREQQKSGAVFTPSDYGLGAEVSNAELDIFLDKAHDDTTRRQSIESMSRLGSLQQGMLFHSLYDIGSGAYIEQFSCDLTNLSLPIFGKSWNEVMKNHSILRSGFYYDAFNIPVQCVYKKVQLPVEVLDYSNLSKEGQASAIGLYQEADRIKGFDFKAAPLMRVGLIRLSEDRFTMIWCFHHILFDGWSLPILMEEFLTTYELLSEGNELTKHDEDRYEDFIRYIEHGNKAKEEAYWRNYMKAVENSTLLPFIASTTERNKGVGAYKSTSIRLEADLAVKVQNYAQQNHITVNTLMQGIWSCLLHRYTGSNNIVYGVIVSGRPDDLPGVERRVGLYINTLPLHSGIQEQQPVIEWLQGLQAEQVASRQYQHTALQSIQAWTGVKGDLFDSILVFENYPISKIVGAKKWTLGVENIHTHEQTNYPITITIGSAEYINIRFRYNSSLLSDQYITEIKDHFDHVLWQLVDETVTNFNDIKLLSTAKETALKVNFNESQVAYPKDKSIVDLVQDQVIKTPGNVVVVFENEQLTYREFNERANQLAHCLRSKGVKEETLVPIFMERSLEMMVALFGIMKAGGAYVPIDPEYPEDRIKFMLEDTNAAVVICTQHTKDRLQKIATTHIVILDADWSEINDQPLHNLSNVVAPHHLAYVIYTSGSTGRPKGVMIEHRSLIDHCFGVIKSAGLQNCKSFALFSPLVFDAGHSMLHSAFLLGASVNVISNRLLTDGQQLAQYINEHAIDCIKIVPSLWLTYADGQNTILARKVMIFGGEGFTVSVLDKLVKANYQGDVYNHYGPTEATIGKTIHKVDLQRQYNNIPIGKPFSNTQLYIVDAALHLVPVGVAGELHIAGDGLARGYLNRNDLTEQKFIADPFSSIPAARMYKTGDMVRWLPDGNIEYLGRIDDQVKIRGFRIEIGEIDTVLQQSELVQQAVVVAKDDGNGNKRLVSYIVPNSSFNKEAMVAYLRSKLPDYMIPVLWVNMESLPLNINGKIDKKALPEPDATDLLSNQYVAPRNELETQLAEIWKEILAVERVGINDNFFELGGHSLLVMRLIASIRRELKVELAISAFFELPTIEELANYIKVNKSNAQQELENYDTIKL